MVHAFFELSHGVHPRHLSTWFLPGVAPKTWLYMLYRVLSGLKCMSDADACQIAIEHVPQQMKGSKTMNISKQHSQNLPSTPPTV